MALRQVGRREYQNKDTDPVSREAQQKDENYSKSGFFVRDVLVGTTC